MDESRSTTQSPSRRGAATPSKDGIHRISVPLSLRLNATDLIRVLLAVPDVTDFNALEPVQVRSLISAVLTQHGYDVLARSSYHPHLDRHQDARQAVRRAYALRFQGAPAEQAALADPLLHILSSRNEEL
ncbi:DUF6181 family protein [Streptomyces murinus]